MMEVVKQESAAKRAGGNSAIDKLNRGFFADAGFVGWALVLLSR